jgi:pimeloyl-ACP methyl ester carboxylesterase
MQLLANGLHLEVDDQGPVGADPLLLIMGLGMQLTAWPQALVDQLVGRGFRVIRLDNRDAGLSQGFDQAGTPNLAWAGLKYGLRLPLQPVYRLGEMAADCAGVLDALGLARAHVCGASMGGMIAQHLAASHPQRVKSLTLMMTTTGARHLPQPAMRVRAALMSRPAGNRPEAVVAHLERLLAVIGSPAFPPDPAQQRQRLQALVARAWRPAGTARQLLAVAADGDRSRLVAGLRLPCAVIHGQADPLIPLAAGQDLAHRIPQALTDFVPGMGHDLPDALLPRFAATIADNAARAPAAPVVSS